MNLQIIYRIIVVCYIMSICTTACRGQVTTSNPLEYAAIIKGEGNINGLIGNQTESMEKIAALQGTISAATTVMKKWESQYNNYLKVTSGFAQNIVASCNLYREGIQTLTALWEINAARNINPQGMFATMPMNNLYLEIGCEFIRTYKSIKNLVKKGGETNMLNGAERTQILWNLQANLERLNLKLRRLALCISIYNFEDVWNNAIAGKIEKTNGMLAAEARDRMQRAVTQVAKFYRYRQEHKPWH